MAAAVGGAGPPVAWRRRAVRRGTATHGVMSEIAASGPCGDDAASVLAELIAHRRSPYASGACLAPDDPVIVPRSARGVAADAPTYRARAKS